MRVFSEKLMARNRKKRGLIGETAKTVAETVTKAAKTTVEAVKHHVVEPVVVKRGPTPKKVKVKRPKYQRPPRTPAKPEKESLPEKKKGLTHSARTLRHSVARSIHTTADKSQEKKGPGSR
jgi:hypothetical protein